MFRLSNQKLGFWKEKCWLPIGQTSYKSVSFIRPVPQFMLDLLRENISECHGFLAFNLADKSTNQIRANQPGIGSLVVWIRRQNRFAASHTWATIVYKGTKLNWTQQFCSEQTGHYHQGGAAVVFKSAWPVASFMSLGYTGACNFLGHDLEANSGHLIIIVLRINSAPAQGTYIIWNLNKLQQILKGKFILNLTVVYND